MRHRRKGRVLGRSPSHQRALLRNLASALFLTERDAELDDNAPKVKGRIITTIQKAKEVRPYVERCITLARRSLAHQEKALQFGPPLLTDSKLIDRNSSAYKTWKEGPDAGKWRAAMSPVVKARRRVLTLLGDKQAMRICFDDIAPRFADRQGGYTRIMRLAKPRLGDNGTRAILEFVGIRDRESQKSQAPAVEETAAN